MSLRPPLPPAPPDAFILAGGQSSRMGCDKAVALLAGVPLVQHACNLLRSIGLEPRIAGSKSDLSAFATTVRDDPSLAVLGPLSGICSALRTTPSPFALFLPVDLPLLPASLMSYLLRHAVVTQSAVTVVSIAGFTQTFPAVIAKAALPSLHSSLRSEDRNSLRALRAAAEHISAPFSVLPVEMLLQAGQIASPQAFCPASWFLNINTPQELQRAGAQLRRMIK